MEQVENKLILEDLLEVGEDIALQQVPVRVIQTFTIRESENHRIDRRIQVEDQIHDHERDDEQIAVFRIRDAFNPTLCRLQRKRLLSFAVREQTA